MGDVRWIVEDGGERTRHLYSDLVANDARSPETRHNSFAVASLIMVR